MFFKVTGKPMSDQDKAEAAYEASRQAHERRGSSHRPTSLAEAHQILDDFSLDLKAQRSKTAASRVDDNFDRLRRAVRRL